MSQLVESYYFTIFLSLSKCTQQQGSHVGFTSQLQQKNSFLELKA
jgi:hypothetical protein